MSSLKPLFEQADKDAAGSLELGIAGDGDLRWAAVDLTAPVEAMRRRLDLSPLASIAIGRASTSAALLLRFSTKVPGRLRLEVLGKGPLGTVMAETDHLGNLRAMVDQPQFGFEDGGLEVGRAVGEGLLRVTQELSNRREPWVSQTALVDGEIGNDLVHFLNQSQQVRSAALLAVLLQPEGVAAAGGLLIEAFPGAADDRVTQLERNIEALPGIGETLADGGVEGLLDGALGGLGRERLEGYPIRYDCACSREMLLERLRGLSDQDLNEVAGEDGKAILECSFCLGQFVFSVEELMA